jgi:hypothetical protein
MIIPASTSQVRHATAFCMEVLLQPGRCGSEIRVSLQNTCRKEDKITSEAALITSALYAMHASDLIQSWTDGA